MSRPGCHSHHIIPKHQGGTDQESNLIDLPVWAHAEVHKRLYEVYGNASDLGAYLILAQQLGDVEEHFQGDWLEFDRLNAERTKALWGDEVYRRKVVEGQVRAWKDPEFRERFSEIRKEMYRTNPDYYNRVCETNREINSRPEVREKKSKKSKEMWEKEEFKDRMKNTHKKRWKNSEFRERMLESFNNPKLKKEQSEQAKKRWEDKEYRESMLKTQKDSWNTKERRESHKKAIRDFHQKKYTILDTKTLNIIIVVGLREDVAKAIGGTVSAVRDLLRKKILPKKGFKLIFIEKDLDIDVKKLEV